MKDIKIKAYQEPLSFGGYNFYGIDEDKGSVILPVTIKDGREDYNIQPFMSLTNHQCQVLMDSLWDCGLRPSEGSGSAGALLATQNHLSDMRKIVFNKLNIKNGR